MKTRPMLMSAPMVRAILAGTKTQTRRVVKKQPADLWPDGVTCQSDARGPIRISPADVRVHLGADGLSYDAACEFVGPIACPYGQPGDRLWVREAFSGPHCMERTDEYPAMPPGQWPKESSIWYWADGNPDYGDWTRPRPSIHMPRWASRILLEIVGVRVERLQDISEADAIAEGVTTIWPDGPRADRGPNHYTIKIDGCSYNAPTAAGVYAMLWDVINGHGSWDANPLVWVVGFKRIEVAA